MGDGFFLFPGFAVRRRQHRLTCPMLEQGVDWGAKEGREIMRKTKRVLLLSAACFVNAVAFTGCMPLSGSTVTHAVTVVYTAGASQHTAAVELSVAAETVFETLVRLIKEAPSIEVVDRNDKAFMIEVTQDKERRITGQVTRLGPERSLLYIWADAGISGQTGRQLGISVVEVICDELGIDYELVSY